MAVDGLGMFLAMVFVIAFATATAFASGFGLWRLALVLWIGGMLFPGALLAGELRFKIKDKGYKLAWQDFVTVLVFVLVMTAAWWFPKAAYARRVTQQ